MTDRQAVKSERSSEAGCDHDGVNGAIRDPELRDAYHLVLDADAAEVDRALASN